MSEENKTPRFLIGTPDGHIGAGDGAEAKKIAEDAAVDYPGAHIHVYQHVASLSHREGSSDGN